MEYIKTPAERGVALLGALVLIVGVLAIVTVPLLQLAGWAKREQIRRFATEGRISARIATLGQLSLPETPQLIAVSGVAQHRYGVELLVSALRSASAEHTPQPSWRAVAEGTLLPFDDSGALPTGLLGPRAARSYAGNRLQVVEPRMMLAANVVRDGEFTVESEQNGSLTILGSIQLNGALQIDARDLSVELIAVGDVEVERIVTHAHSLRIRSLFGRIRCKRFDATRCTPAILLEAAQGIEVGGEARGNELGCALERVPGIWLPYEIAGERVIPPK